jgi:hypothetical protein
VSRTYTEASQRLHRGYTKATQHQDKPPLGIVRKMFKMFDIYAMSEILGNSPHLSHNLLTFLGIPAENHRETMKPVVMHSVILSS